MDLNRVSLVVGLKIEGFSVWHITLKINLNKVFKHEKMCSHNQHPFISFVFDNVDFLVSKTNNFLKRVKNLCITISCSCSVKQWT